MVWNICYMVAILDANIEYYGTFNNTTILQFYLPYYSIFASNIATILHIFHTIYHDYYYHITYIWYHITTLNIYTIYFMYLLPYNIHLIPYNIHSIPFHSQHLLLKLASDTRTKVWTAPSYVEVQAWEDTHALIWVLFILTSAATTTIVA